MLKSTGIIRKLDKLGRVVIPIDIRDKFGICENDLMEIFVYGSSIVLNKHEPNCIFCGATKKLVSYNNKLVCKKCAEKLKNLTDN